MLSYFIQLVNKNKSDIILVISIILISLISFGAGWLLSSKPYNQPIIIQESSCNILEKNNINIKQKNFVGSVNSNKYHLPNCSWAKKISSENQIWFDSEQEAKNAGYVKCGKFQTLLTL